MSGRVHLRAPAKVNLILRILGARGDGYHDVETLFQAIDLCDLVEVQLEGEEIELEVEGPEPCRTEENLAFRAARGFRSLGCVDGGIRIRLAKRIPAGAGLGGGSSDAAAVLRGLSTLIGTGLDSAVLELAADLGSDVPFFLGASPLASGTGRGEILEPLPPLPEQWLVLALPPVHVSTGEAYRALSQRRGREEPRRPRPMIAPTSWSDVVARLQNDFQSLVASSEPTVAEALGALERTGASGVLLSGSGAAAFGLFSGRARARAAAERLREDLGWPCLAVRTLTELPEPRRNPAP